MQFGVQDPFPGGPFSDAEMSHQTKFRRIFEILGVFLTRTVEMAEKHTQHGLLGLLLLCAVYCGTHALQAPDPQITIIQPSDAARLWVDEEHPAVVEVLVEGVDMPSGGHVKIFVNGR